MQGRVVARVGLPMQQTLDLFLAGLDQRVPRKQGSCRLNALAGLRINKRLVNPEHTRGQRVRLARFIRFSEAATIRQTT